MTQPIGCGSASLLLIGFVGGLQNRIRERLVIALGVVVVMATLSFASLVVPVAAASLLPIRRGARCMTFIAVSAISLGILWVNPLHVEFAGRTLYDRSPESAYFEDGLGPRFMPGHSVVASGMRFDFYFTGYAALAARSVSCAIEHPLGVGGRDFILACPAWVMNTYGGWGQQHSAHNDYGALLSEGGLLTTIATLMFVAWLASSSTFRRDGGLAAAILASYLVVANGGASLYQYPFAAVLAVAIECRRLSR